MASQDEIVVNSIGRMEEGEPHEEDRFMGRSRPSKQNRSWRSGQGYILRDGKESGNLVKSQLFQLPVSDQVSFSGNDHFQTSGFHKHHLQLMLSQ